MTGKGCALCGWQPHTLPLDQRKAEGCLLPPEYPI